MITAQMLRNIGYFLANTDRHQLEEKGLVETDDNWRRFNHDFDIFVLKLPDDKLEVLADMISRYLAVHPDDVAVDRFTTAMADAMKAKLAAKRDHGYGGWDDPERCRIEFLSRKLREHVAKGDPVDVANFAMMIHQRGARIMPPEEIFEAAALADDAMEHFDWHVAKGRVAMDEPLYAAIFQDGDDEIGAGESDDSAAEAIRIAAAAARKTLARRANG